MVLPDGNLSSRGGLRRSRAGVLALGAAAVLVGGLTLGSLTTPDPEAIAPSTTSATTTTLLERPVDIENFTVDQIAIGQPLAWELTTSLPANGAAHALIEHEGRFYVFAGLQELWGPITRGLVAWRSDDGATWEKLSQVIEVEHRITNVVSTDRGLIALESGRPARLWMSTDGADWEPIDLPTADDPYMETWPVTVAATDRILTVAVHDQIDIQGILEEHLSAIAGAPVDLSGLRYGWEPRDGDLQFDVWAPFGLEVYDISATELGLGEEVSASLLESATGTQEVRILTRFDGEDWQFGQLDLPSVEQMISDPAGRLVAFGYGDLGPRMYRTSDGITWEETSSIEVHQITRWGDELVGLRDSWFPEVLVSRDGETWQETGLSDHFPRSLGWYSQPPTGSPGGIALSVEAAHRGEGPRSLEPPTVERDGHVFKFDPNSGVLVLEGIEPVRAWGHLRGPIEFDTVTRAIALQDEATGETLATFTVDELAEIESDLYWQYQSAGERHIAFAFTADGSTWTIQDFGEVVGEETQLVGLEINETQVVALIADSPFLGAGFQVWTASIP